MEPESDIATLESEATKEYLAKEAENIKMAEMSLRPPNWQNLELNDPRIGGEFVIPEFNTEEGMKVRGILDDKGEATLFGEDYLMLEDQGLLKDGALTEKGIAFTTPEEELFNTAEWVDNGMTLGESPEKERIYAIRRKAGLDKPEPSEDGIFTELWKGLKGFGAGADVLLRGTFTGKPIEEVRTAQAQAVGGLVKGAAVSLQKTASAVQKTNVFGQDIGLLPTLEKIGLMSKEEATRREDQIAYETEMLDRTLRDTSSVELAEIVGAGDEVANAVEATRQNYVAQFGEKDGDKKFTESLNNYESVGQAGGDVPGLALGMATVGLGAGFRMIRTADATRKAEAGLAAVTQGRRLTEAKTLATSAAQKLSDDISLTSGKLDDAVKIGDSAKSVELTEKLNTLTSQFDELGSQINKIDDGIKNVSDFANKTEVGIDSIRTAGDASRRVASGAIKGVAVGAEKLGAGVASLNSFVRKTERLFGFNGVPKVIQAATLMTNPVAFGVYAGTKVGLIVAPVVLRKMGNFGRVMSEEMLERTSSTPFFKRVAANESVGGLGRAVASLGDYSSPLARGVVGVSKGVAQTAPATLVYNAINEQGVDETTVARAGRDALIFGSLGRVIGGKKNMDQVNADQMFNYRNKLDADQIAVFDQLKDRDFRYALSGLDAAYPGMFKWEIAQSGNNFFDPANRRAVVNINDKVGFLKEVAMHEAGHMIQHVWQNDSAIVSRMLGDETRSGLVRNVDGTLDAEFSAWSQEYNNLREQNGISPADLSELAVEYFTDQGVKTLLEDTLKGNLYKESRKTPLRRSVENTFRTLFNATPIVKNLHFKLGGATDATGRMVMGTGLLADGFREIPEVKSMVRQMYRETSGKPSATRPPRLVDVASDNPKHYGADPAIKNVNEQIVARGEKLPDNVLVPDENGNGEGFLTSDHLKALEEAGVIDNGRFGEALFLQDALEASQKHGLLVTNKPFQQGRSVQIEGIAEGYVVPTKWVLKKGRLYLESMDLRQLEKNVKRAAKNNIAKELGLKPKSILEDIEKSVEIQNSGKSTDAYYQSVDPANWERRKNFINSVLGRQTKRQLSINPLMSQVSPDPVTGIFRTFAFDRIQSAIKTSGDVVIPFGPSSYYSIKNNLMPQSPRFNRNGELIPEVSGVKLMPQSKPKVTRLAAELAKKAKVSVSKVRGSGVDNSITPNDIRAYIQEQEGKFKPLAFQKEPPMAVDPTISDLVGSEVNYQGQTGIIIDDSGRPALQGIDGNTYELPFGYFTDQSSREVGLIPTGRRAVDKNNLIKEFEETSRTELQKIFGYIDDNADKISELAELGNSAKRVKGRKSEIVRDTPDFQQYVRGVTDQQILQAWDRTEKALDQARKSKNIGNEDIQSIINKFEGDIRNIEKLAEAIDVFKQQRVSRQVVGQEATTKVSGTSKADLISQMEIESRAAGAKNKALNIKIPSSTPTRTASPISYRRGNKEYRDSALAKSISFAISGLSEKSDK